VAIQFRVVAAAALLAGPCSAFAKSEPSLPGPNTVINETPRTEILEEVVVTGSRIPRRDFNTPSPLTTVGKASIEFTPLPTIEETLNQMPQVLPSYDRTTNNGSTGESTVDLRGLGPGRTLVLLNGRRVAPSDVGNEVDLNNIPRFLLKQVEIITGGTSTVYGSDAIAGVVNFITVNDYEGFGLEAGYNVTQDGDADSYDLSFAYGHNFADSRGNISVYLNWMQRDALYADAREFTRVTYYDDWEGNLVQSGSWFTPAGVVIEPTVDLGAGEVPVTFNKDGTPRAFAGDSEAYNFAPATFLQTPLDRTVLGAMGHYDISDRLEGYVEASFIRNQPSYALAPTPVFGNIVVNIDNPLLSAEARQLFAEFYTCEPNLACFAIFKRFPEFGPRIGESKRDYSRLLAGARGDLGKGWAIDGWLTYTKASSSWDLTNAASNSRLQQGLLVDPATNQCHDPSGGCVPLNIFGEENLSAEAIDFLRYPPLRNATKRTQQLASVFVTGSPLDTMAGPVDMAFGFEWRRDNTEFHSDENLFSGDITGYDPMPPVDGVESVTEVYVEALIPLADGKPWAEDLELELGGRYSLHRHASGVWTYKAGGMWQPLGGLRLRAMHQRSVRAPDSGELFTAQSSFEWHFVSRDGIEDPCSASADPVGSGNVQKCELQGLPADQIGVFEAKPYYPTIYYSGGNPDVDPEVGKTWTLGAIVSPSSLPHFILSIDYFDFELKGVIGDIDAGSICFDPVNTGNVFCENLRRDETGNVYAVYEYTSNRGVQQTTGLDFHAQYDVDLPAWLAIGDQSADLAMSLFWTHTYTFKIQENPATEVLECAGYFGWPCEYRAYPANRVTGHFTYTTGPVEVQLSWRWIDGTDNAAPKKSAIYGYPDPNMAIPMVSSKNYLDLGMVYNFNDRFWLRFGIANLTETGPPMMADQAWQNNTDTGLYDAFGRSYYLRFSAQF